MVVEIALGIVLAVIILALSPLHNRGSGLSRRLGDRHRCQCRADRIFDVRRRSR
jgi:hypothetical protein